MTSKEFNLHYPLTGTYRLFDKSDEEVKKDLLNRIPQVTFTKNNSFKYILPFLKKTRHSEYDNKKNLYGLNLEHSEMDTFKSFNVKTQKENYIKLSDYQNPKENIIAFN